MGFAKGDGRNLQPEKYLTIEEAINVHRACRRSFTQWLRMMLTFAAYTAAARFLL
jgi:hypothetical protein